MEETATQAAAAKLASAIGRLDDLTAVELPRNPEQIAEGEQQVLAASRELDRALLR